MYIILIKRSGNNPLTGRAQYRVDDCFKNTEGSYMTFLYLNEAQCLFIWSQNKKQIGSFINPRKEIFGIKRATFGLVKG